MSWTSCKKCKAGLEQYDVYCWSCGEKQNLQINSTASEAKLQKEADEQKIEVVTNLSDTPIMCKCGDKRKNHYDNWGDYTGCSNKLNCGCSKFVLTN